MLPGDRRGVRAVLRAALVAAVLAVLALLGAAPASAHVVPSSALELDVGTTGITADLTLPTADLVTASGIDVPSAGPLDPATADAVAAYVEQHLQLASSGRAWRVEVSGAATDRVRQWGTALFPAVTATAVLTPPTAGDLRSFTLTDDAIVHQVVTSDTFVVLRRDPAAGDGALPRALGTLSVDTVTGRVPPLVVDLDAQDPRPGFLGVLRLGVSHIADGTDHQLFLLTLLLPAPLLARGGRWSGSVRPGVAVRRTTAVTAAFTVGHSLTLALGALGLPVPQRPVEAAIALSVLVAAAHAARPLFPGREPLVAGFFGLVHGTAFSATLSDLDLSGGQLALSLLGFNLGIELMQLVVVLLVLPPLLVLARTRLQRPLRTVAAGLTALAALGWLLDRVGVGTPLGTAADALGPASPGVVLALWGATLLVLVRTRVRAQPVPGPRG